MVWGGEPPLTLGLEELFNIPLLISNFHMFIWKGSKWSDLHQTWIFQCRWSDPTRKVSNGAVRSTRRIRFAGKVPDAGKARWAGQTNAMPTSGGSSPLSIPIPMRTPCFQFQVQKRNASILQLESPNPAFITRKGIGIDIRSQLLSQLGTPRQAWKCCK